MVRTEGRRVDKGLTARVAVATEVAEVGVKEVAGAAKEAVAGAAKGLAGKGGLVLGSVLSRVQAGLKTAVEETTRGVKVLATNVERGLGGMGGGAGVIDGAEADRLAVLQGARREHGTAAQRHSNRGGSPCGRVFQGVVRQARAFRPVVPFAVHARFSSG